MKNLIYILLGAGFLAIISSSASGFLTTETSNTLDNLYEETFYIDPENIVERFSGCVSNILSTSFGRISSKISDTLTFDFHP